MINTTHSTSLNANSKTIHGLNRPQQLKQTFTNAAVHPAVMSSTEENVTLQFGLVPEKAQFVRVGPFPMTSRVILVKL